MNYSTDLSAIGWLKIGEQPVVMGQPFRVANALPDVFEAYTTLLPAVGHIEGFPYDQINLTNSSIEQLNKNAAIWSKYGIYDAHRVPAYKPTSFRELATHFKLPFSTRLMNELEWRKGGVAINWEKTGEALFTLLNQLTAVSPLSMYAEDAGWRWHLVQELLPSPDDVLYHVTIQEFVDFMSLSSFDATLYLFPENRKWCLVNIEDCSVIVIGTDKATAARITEMYPLETLPLLHESPM